MINIVKIKSEKLIIVLHENPDLDAITAARLLTLFGEKKYPGISEAKFLFWSGGPNPILQGENFIPIDIGGGLFDHHPTNKFPNDCAATKVAKYLEIDQDPALREILEYVLKHDLQGIRNPLGFADFVRCFNQKYPENPEIVLQTSFGILDTLYEYTKETSETPTQKDRDSLANLIEDWVQDKDKLFAQQIIKFAKGLRNGNRRPFDLTVIFCALQKKYPEKVQTKIRELLDAKYLLQQLFFKSKEELKKAKVVPIIRGRGDEILNVVTVNSDNPSIAALSRHPKYGCNAAIVIQKNSNGRTLIFTNNRFCLANNLLNIVAMVRLEELLKRKKRILNFRKLIQSGYIQYIENWYFQKENNKGGGKLLNGSLTAPDVEPTKISLDRIEEIVITALNLGQHFNWKRWVKEAIALNNKLQQV